MTTHVTSAAELEEHKTNDVLNIISLVILVTAFITILVWAFGLIGLIKLGQIEGALLLFWIVVKLLNTPKSSTEDLAGSSNRGSNQGEVLMYFFFFFAIFMLITTMLTKLVIARVLHVDRLDLNEFNMFLVNITAVILNICFAIIWFKNSFTFNKAKAANIYQLVISGDMIKCGKNLRPLPLVGICLISPFKGAVEGSVLEYRDKSRFLEQKPGKIGKTDEDGQVINIKHRGKKKSIPRVVKWYLEWTIDNTMLYELTEYGKDALEEEKRRVESMIFGILESALHEADCQHVEEYEPLKPELSNKVFGRLVEAMRPIGLRPISFMLKSVERTSDEEVGEINRSVETTKGEGFRDIVTNLKEIPGMTTAEANMLAAAMSGDISTDRSIASITDDPGTDRKRRKSRRATQLEDAVVRAAGFEATEDDSHRHSGGNSHDHNPGDGGE